ncbi:GNAT family N-acetyltransferase [Comamonas piscis]|uniref:GNAT family N-acetyltransferase n=1 Tax=Comamonas piscis TaxID=1562974 RepID=A0A7G5ECW6_9BURK|nr:GNAT family N-acetyltransferase [Comamonas piscis]QMV71841.1 GNAT family N-acetyltransferase [Comamonas piscis]WSO34573.1 GNAT family N-acetyltransferase [Comamonas piscis]
MRFSSHDQPNWSLEPLTAQHLDGLMQVQLACYGADFMESAALYAARLASPVQCSLVVVQGSEVLAYLAAYRSVLGKVTPLHGGFACASPADTLYLHDMAVAPARAGEGLASALLQAMLQQAQADGLRYSALVSVMGSQPYWQRKGYAPLMPVCLQHQAALQSYGDDAQYMAQALL